MCTFRLHLCLYTLLHFGQKNGPFVFVNLTAGIPENIEDYS